MISGRQAFASIEAAISEEQSAVLDLERKLEGLLQEEETQRRDELEEYRNLARLRLEDISGDNVIERLNRVEKQAIALLANREQARSTLQSRLGSVNDRVAALTRERESKADALENAQEKVTNAEAGTRARLETDTKYTKQRALAHRTDVQAANAEEKAAQSESELAAKRAAYESNALFMYLWKRRYGTPDYSASSIIRALDGWVASLVRYQDARTNFFRLQEIPKRLREHAERLSEMAEVEEQKLDAIWHQARIDDGLQELDAALKAAEEDLGHVEEQLEQTVADRQDIVDELAKYAAGEDELSLQAIDLISGELRDEDLMMLFRQAKETLRQEDDLIVSRIIDRRQDIGSLEISRRQLKDTLDRRLKRIKELGSVSREFKRRNYAQSNSSFRDGALIAMLLRDFLSGGLSQENLWEQIARQQRWRRVSRGPSIARRRSATFGGGGRSSGRSGGFGGRSSGGGGFRTGGGF